MYKILNMCLGAGMLEVNGVARNEGSSPLMNQNPEVDQLLKSVKAGRPPDLRYGW
jgi:hypothetical protein